MFAALIDRLPSTVITNDGGEPYLLRVYLLRVLRSVLPGVFLHRFFRSDGDRELHNHPWPWAVALILSGGYREERLHRPSDSVRTRVVRPGRLNFIRGDTFHRIELLDPERGCWTLFVAAPRKAGSKSWGFLDVKTGEFETNDARDARLQGGT